MDRNFYSGLDTGSGYFSDLIDNPYRSTIKFEQSLKDVGFFCSLKPGSEVWDLGCGTGANTARLARAYPDLQFVGIDSDAPFIATAESRYPQFKNLRFQRSDIKHLQRLEGSNLQAFVAYQTINFLDIWWDELFSLLLEFPVQRTAFSALLWQGFSESKVTHFVDDESGLRGRNMDYNVFSLRKIEGFMLNHGWALEFCHPFTIDVDLPRPLNGVVMGSYTVRLENGERMLFSLWQALPWHFASFKRQ